MPLILYGFVGSPPCRTVLIVAEALGLKLEIKNVDFMKGEHFTPEYLKLNPLHTVPTLDDNGTILVDSHAIAAYLVAKYGKDNSLYPKDLAKRALVDAKLHFDTGYVFTTLGKIVKEHIFGEQKELLTSKQVEEIENVYGFLNKFLEGSNWLVGDSLTIADISLIATVSSLETPLPVDSDKYPHVRRWLDDAKKVPFFKINAEGLEQFKFIWSKLTTNKK